MGVRSELTFVGEDHILVVLELVLGRLALAVVHAPVMRIELVQV
jgi:hypothetical protein